MLFLQALSSACVIGSLNHGAADITDVANAALAWELPSAPTPDDWLVVGIARATIDGPVAAAPVLQRALDWSAMPTTDERSVHMFGYRCAAATIRWDVDSLRELGLLHVAATRQLGGLTLLPTALTSLANAFILQGDLERAASANAEAAQIDSGDGEPPVVLGRGDPGGARGDDDAAALIDAQIDFAAPRASASAR